MSATEHENTAMTHRREAVRHLKLGDAHREISVIQDEIERLQHRRGMLEDFITAGGIGDLPGV
jgi:ubiquinone biosynthesis protein UbiJ